MVPSEWKSIIFDGAGSMITKTVNYKVSFRIISDELDPYEITELLNIEPTSFHRKGDPNRRLTKKGKCIKYSLFNTGLWGLDSGMEKDSCFESHVLSILDRLEPAQESLNTLFKRGYKFDFFCGIFFNNVQAGFDIDHSLLRRLSDLHISLGFDIYCTRPNAE